MPLCYRETQLQSLNNNNNKNVSFSGENVIIKADFSSGIAMSEPPKQSKFKSQPMPKGVAFQQDGSQTRKANRNHSQPGIKMFRDKRFDSFKTWSGGGLERQLSILRGKEPISNAQDCNNTTRSFDRALPVDRYFDALEGPELETLRVSDLVTFIYHLILNILCFYSLKIITYFVFPLTTVIGRDNATS